VSLLDAVSLARIDGTTSHEKLQKLLYESAVLTAAYKATGADGMPALSLKQDFLIFDKSANRKRMADFLDAVVAVGLMHATEVDHELAGQDDFGSGSMQLASEYDQKACVALFFDAGGNPRSSEFYQGVGRSALLALVGADEEDNYRRIPLENLDLWKRMVDVRNVDRSILPPPITGGPAEAVRVGDVRTDFITILWWAEAMATAAKKLAAVRDALKTVTPATLDTDKGFNEARRDLHASLTKAVAKNTALFGDPWGFVALFDASQGQAQVSASIVSSRLQLSLP
jgi:hypothetical protein